MKNRILILSVITALILLPIVSMAEPTIGGVNGVMEKSQWDGYQAKEFNRGDYLGPGYGGQDYDVEKIGIYVDDTHLYIGLQTGFELYGREPDGRTWSNRDIPGHIAVGFTNYKTPPNHYSDLSPSDYQFSFEFDFKDNSGNYDLSDPDLIVRKVDSWQIVNYNNLDDEGYPLLASGQVLGKVEDELGGAVAYTKSDGNFDPYTDPYRNTIEAAIKLSDLKTALSDFDFDAGFNANIFWTMSCNNDMLGKTFSHYVSPGGGPNHAPEPNTLLLFGIGLLGASSLGRKRIKSS